MRIERKQNKLPVRNSARKDSVGEIHKSAITDHVAQQNYVINWEEAKVIDQDSDKQTRSIREGLINRDDGTSSLSHVYDQLLQKTLQSGNESRNTTSGSEVVGPQ